MVLSEHAGVANAIGAVVGRVTVRKSVTITSPSDGLYRVHYGDEPHDFVESDAAIMFAKNVLNTAAIEDAYTAGAQQVDVKLEEEIKLAQVDNRQIFVEATLTVTATGRPGY